MRKLTLFLAAVSLVLFAEKARCHELAFSIDPNTRNSLRYSDLRVEEPDPLTIRTGRFLSVDPGGYAPSRPQSWNRYSYTENNPVHRVDPDGRVWDIVIDLGLLLNDIVEINHTYFIKHQPVTAVQNASIAGNVVGAAVPGATGVGPVIRGAAKTTAALAKRGPKTDANAPHNAKVAEVAASVKDGTVIAGGGQAPERLIPTPGGHKSGRRPDILVERPDGSIYGINVGRTEKKSGLPVKREREAIQDLEGAGVEMHYVPYDRPPSGS